MNFGLAGSQAAGTYAAWGTPTVKFHQSRGALSGLMAALLAHQGFVATHEFLTTPDGGLFPAYSGGGDLDKVTRGFGDRWELEQVALRLWPSSARTQGIVTAMFELLTRHDLKPDGVKEIRISLGKDAFELHGTFPTFAGKFEAMLSAHYAAAAILFDRELWLDQFEPARYNDPALRRFAAHQVQVFADESLKGPQAAVVAETTDGRLLEARCEVPKGDPANFVSRADLESKFQKSARGMLTPDEAARVIGMVENLESLESASSLMDALMAH